ncbi:glycosyl hydrolase YngK-like [Biomphalaria glabrata]|uniref:Glycosyl hydrolase YngK-like n=1 Tax=Biomphalaria glabrata TaxID=6526 RepID=A0A9W3BI49_BIOGL|nr:glycosyl hydrolase YngK-like [Biomphalaria glabrata]
MVLKVVLLSILLCGIISLVDSACSAGRTKRELRGAWIATVNNKDWPRSMSETTQANKLHLIYLLNILRDANFNAVFFQVRSAGEAMYASSIEPWSQYLTGTQGMAPSPAWDPLQFLIDEAHARNMEVHAWFNPFKATSGTISTAGMSANHIAKVIPAHVHPFGRNLWMDPGSDEVQDWVVNVTLDVVRRYDIDGVHMDGYFYPISIGDRITLFYGGFDDSATYNAYQSDGGTMSRADWRRDNVNKFVERLSTKIHETKDWVKFGVSPFGIWRSGYPSGITGISSVEDFSTDSRLWLQKGWVDYLAPQLYWTIDGPQNFSNLLDWWSDSAQNPTHKHIYASVADYRIVDNNWSPDEMVHQIQEVQMRTNRQVWDEIYFNAHQLQSKQKISRGH